MRTGDVCSNENACCQAHSLDSRCCDAITAYQSGFHNTLAQSIKVHCPQSCIVRQ